MNYPILEGGVGIAESGRAKDADGSYYKWTDEADEELAEEAAAAAEAEAAARDAYLEQVEEIYQETLAGVRLVETELSKCDDVIYEVKSLIDPYRDTADAEEVVQIENEIYEARTGAESFGIDRRFNNVADGAVEACLYYEEVVEDGGGGSWSAEDAQTAAEEVEQKYERYVLPYIEAATAAATFAGQKRLIIQRLVDNFGGA